jgi:hypothetical protein
MEMSKVKSSPLSLQDEIEPETPTDLREYQKEKNITRSTRSYSNVFFSFNARGLRKVLLPLRQLR